MTLAQHGAVADPRTFALYLATRGESAELAVNLSKKELMSREDVFTHDALAWALAEAGYAEEAREQMELALAEGTQDARMFLHAAVIAAKSKRVAEAKAWLEKAGSLQQTLLPSERKQFQSVAASLPTQTTAAATEKLSTRED